MHSKEQPFVLFLVSDPVGASRKRSGAKKPMRTLNSDGLDIC